MNKAYNNDGTLLATNSHYGMSYCQSIYNTIRGADYNNYVITPEKFLNSKYPHPARTIWVVDTGKGGYAFVPSAAAILERVGNIHNRGPNIVYMDGHTEWKKLYEIQVKEVDPLLP